MYESVVTVGERGQITIPQIIREKEGLKKKNKVIVGIENGRIFVDKVLAKKEKEKLLEEYCKKYADFNKKVAEEWKYVSTEADKMLDEY